MPSKKRQPIKILTNRAEIYIGPGKVALVSPEDVPSVKDFCWHFRSWSKARPGNSYVITTPWVKELKRTRSTRLHHMILPKKHGYIVDHINANPLDNRRSNLRYATHTQNSYNRGKMKRDGLLFAEKVGKWRARIRFEKRLIHLGYFETREEALKARIEAEKHYFGEFAPRR